MKPAGSNNGLGTVEEKSVNSATSTQTIQTEAQGGKKGARPPLRVRDKNKQSEICVIEVLEKERSGQKNI